MIAEKVISFTRALYNEDPKLLEIAGYKIPIFREKMRKNPGFISIVHTARAKYENDPVSPGFYYVDILDESLSSATISLVADRIMAILDKKMDESGGGLRFFIRDRHSYAIESDKWTVGESLLFEFRGADTALNAAKIT